MVLLLLLVLVALLVYSLGPNLDFAPAKYAISTVKARIKDLLNK